MAQASRDENFVPTLLGVSNADGTTPVKVYADPTTHRLLVDIPGSTGTVTEVSVATANGFAGTVADPTTTPEITIETTVTGIVKGNGTAISAAVANTDYQVPISLTTTGTSGAATFNGTTLNIPNYTNSATIGGTIAANQVAYGSGVNTIQGSANLTFDGTTLNIDADMRFANTELLLFRGATDVNPGIIFVDGSNNFNINTESLTYPMFIDASTVNIGNNAGTGTLNFGVSGGKLTLTSTVAVFNENSGDIDFRVESNDNANAIFVDAGNNRVGILNGSPTVALDVTGAILASTSVTAPAILATANDSGAIGASGTAFSDLFLASGAVINFAAGNSVITHSSAVLEVTTGDLRVTTAGTNSASVVTVAGTQTLTSKTLTSPTITTATLSGAQQLAEGASLRLDAALSADGTYSGETISGTAGATLAFGDLIYKDPTDSRWELCDANAASGADGDARGTIGICVLAAAADGDPTVILLQGNVRADAAFPSMTINAPMYVSETAGDITGTIPTTTDAVMRCVGQALTADELLFQPSSDWATHT